MPALDSPCFQVYINAFGRAYPGSMNVMVVDGAPAHVADSLIIPDTLVLFRLPPYCPELNPMERIWQDLRQRLSAGLPAGLEALRDDAARVICEYTPEILASIAGVPYLLAATAQIIHRFCGTGDEGRGDYDRGGFVVAPRFA